MKASRSSGEEIIAVLREHEAGAKTAEVCRRHGLSYATFCKWKAKYGDMEVSDPKRLKALEDENRRLKKLLAESMLDNAALKDIFGKNGRSLQHGGWQWPSGRAAQVQSAPRVQADRDRSFDFAVSEHASGRRAATPGAAGVDPTAPPARLSQIGLAVGSREAFDEPQKTVSAGSREKVDGAPACGASPLAPRATRSNGCGNHCTLNRFEEPTTGAGRVSGRFS